MTTPTTSLIIGKEFANQVVPLIKAAKKNINIIVFDWRWYHDQIGAEIQRFNHALIIARRKGVRIRAITNPFKTISILRELTMEVKKPITKGLMHTKLMLIDNEIAILGSHNYTMNAFTINYEVSVIIREKEVIERLKQYFDNIWQ